MANRNPLRKYFPRFILKLQNDPYFKFVFLVGLGFSAFLMFSTLSYSNGSIELRQSMSGDFWGHIPLIRSFSFGNNTPLQYPQFLGERMHYHFLFYLLAGILEKFGTRIDLAINILSTFSFFALILAIYKLTLNISKSKAAGILAVIMLIFNSSFSWIYYVSSWGFNMHSFSDIVLNKRFAAFGPFDNNIIEAFWNLNLYTNQRHTPISLALMFFCIWILAFNKKKSLHVLALAGCAVMPILNQALIIPLFVTLGLAWLGLKTERKRVMVNIVLALLVSLPLLFTFGGGANIRFDPGFLYDHTSWHELDIHNNLLKWIIFWFLNLGLLPVFALIGFLLVRPLRRFKKISEPVREILSRERVFFVSAILIWIMANLIVIPQDAMNNHKFINFSIIIFNCYAAYAVVRIYQLKKIRLIAVSGFLILILGGVFDVFPLFNNLKVFWPDLSSDTTATWIYRHTKPEATFLNLSSFTMPILTAGRRIYFGSSDLTWTIGYDPYARVPFLQKVTQGGLPKAELCGFLTRNNLSYIVIRKEDYDFAGVTVNLAYFAENFVKVDTTQDVIYLIYDVSSSCITDSLSSR
jgi:hypothetical protein